MGRDEACSRAESCSHAQSSNGQDERRTHVGLWQGELGAADDVLPADAELLRAVSAYHDLHLLQRRIAALAAEQPSSLLRAFRNVAKFPAPQKFTPLDLPAILDPRAGSAVAGDGLLCLAVDFLLMRYSCTDAVAEQQSL